MSFQVYSCSLVEESASLEIYPETLYELTLIPHGETPFGNLVAYLGPPVSKDLDDLRLKVESSAFAVQVMTEDLQQEINKTELEKKKTETARKALMASQKAHKDVSDELERAKKEIEDLKRQLKELTEAKEKL